MLESRFRQLELPRIELLVHHDHAGAVPGQHFHRVSPLPDEDEKRPRSRSRLSLHLFAHQPESLEPEAHVHRLERHEDR